MRAQTVNIESRRSHRLRVDLRARLRQRGSTSRLDVDMIDLSPHGFRCRTRSPMVPGQHVMLTLPGLSALEAVVAWSSGDQRGCDFSHPLHYAVFLHISRSFA